jgi:hypothetical protein
MNKTAEKQALDLLNSELNLINEQIENYKELEGSLYILDKKEREKHRVNTECLKAQKTLLRRVMLTLETLVY